MDKPKRLRKHCDGEIYFWIEQESSIHLKALAGSSDPVEMSFNEAREMGRLLIELADEGERGMVAARCNG